jgi:hypothetical protein
MGYRSWVIGYGMLPTYNLLPMTYDLSRCHALRVIFLCNLWLKSFNRHRKELVRGLL